MPLSATNAKQAIDFFTWLEDKLNKVYPGTRMGQIPGRALEVCVTNCELKRELPELVPDQIAHCTIWQQQFILGIKERYDLGTQSCDASFAQLHRLKTPRITADRVKAWARLVANRLACEEVPEYTNLNSRQPVLAIVHREKHNGPASPKTYQGSSIYLRHDWYCGLESSPIEQHLRQYLDFLHTMRQESHQVRMALRTR